MGRRTLLGLGLVFAGCAAPMRPTSTASKAPLSSASPSSSGSPSASSVAAGTTVAVTFEQRVDVGRPQLSHVFLAAKSIGFEAEVVQLDALAACAVEDATTKKKSAAPGNWDSYDQHPPAAPALLTCGADAAALVAHDDRLVVGKHEVFLGARPTWQAGPVPHDAMPCDAGVVGPKLALGARISVTTSGDLWLELVVPRLGITLPLAEGLGYVHALPNAAPAQSLLISGHWMEHGLQVVVSREGDTLRVTSESGGYGDHDPEHTVGRYWLPCGATLDPKPAFARSALWFAMGDDCDACGDRQSLCSIACLTKHGDAGSVLSPDGVACLERCEKTSALCATACRAKIAKKYAQP